jgi:hypothetical protein
MNTFDCRISGTCKINAEDEDEAKQIVREKPFTFWDWDDVEVEEED